MGNTTSSSLYGASRSPSPVHRALCGQSPELPTASCRHERHQGGGAGGDDGATKATVDFLGQLPVEIAAKVASFLDEPDIKRMRLVGRSWCAVANSELVWKHLCQLKWGSLKRPPRMVGGWKETHRLVWLAARVANCDGAVEGYAYLAAHGFVPSVMTVEAEAELLDTCRALDPRTVGSRLADSVVEEGEELRSSLMDAFIRRQRYRGVFLPEAMRRLFAKARFPGHSSMSIAPVLHYFVGQYIRDNPDGAPGTNRPCLPDGEERLNIHTLCYAIILLSVDLFNHNVKVKMSRREFIRNNAFMAYDDEYLMRIYDNVWMWGHIAEPKRTSPRHELGRRNIERLLS